MSDLSVGLCPMPSASENFVPVSNVQMLSACKGFAPRPPMTLHHHHHRLTSFFHAAAQVRRFPRMSLLHTSRSCVSITLSFKFAMSVSTHSRHDFLAYHGLCFLHFQLLYVCMLTPNHQAAFVPHVQTISIYHV